MLRNETPWKSSLLAIVAALMLLWLGSAVLPRGIAVVLGGSEVEEAPTESEEECECTTEDEEPPEVVV